MLKLRLQRRGKKNFATYRVVVAEQHAPIKGRFIADVGSYNPHTNAFTVDKEKVAEWLKQGVQPSDTVHNLLVTHGLLKEAKVTIWRPPASEAVAPSSEIATPAETTPPAAPATAEPTTPA
ncbi:MAG: 30S ribosomal protein S16 [Candidatus Andersenbacteria bacterium]